MSKELSDLMIRSLEKVWLKVHDYKLTSSLIHLIIIVSIASLISKQI